MKSVLFRSLFCAGAFLVAMPAMAQYNSNYEYTLNFELDSRTGKYRPAYTYQTSSGNSTIWLDGSDKGSRSTGRNSRTSSGEVRRFISYTPPKGWSLDKNAERVEISSDDRTTFTLFKSRVANRNQEDDFRSEWQSRLGSKYGAKATEISRVSSFKGKGDFLVASSVVEVNGKPRGFALATLYSGDRAFPILFEFPSYEQYKRHKSEMTAFIGTIDIQSGTIEK